MSPILLVTETTDLAADLLVLELAGRGLPFVRFNQDEFPDRIELAWDIDRGDAGLCVAGRCWSVADISRSWYRHARVSDRDGEAAAFIAREALAYLESFWEATPWFWVNRPSAARRAEQKPLQLLAAQRAGFLIPATCITNSPAAARALARSQPVIAKPLAGGQIKADGCDYAIFTTPVTVNDLQSDEAVRACPTIYQHRIERGFDLRVTIVGDHIFAAAIQIADRRPEEVDWRAAEPARLSCHPYDLPEAITRCCRRLMHEFALSYAALDLMIDCDGRYFFLEINPSGQWGWVERRTGAPITAALIDLLAAAS